MAFRTPAQLVTVATLAGLGCAHAAWRDDPSAEPRRVCAASDTRSEPPSVNVASARKNYCLGLYAPAVVELSDEVLIEQETGKRDIPGALRWLVYISRRFPRWDHISDVVGQAERSDLHRPELADVRADLYLLAARFDSLSEQFDEALELLHAIPPASPLRARAALLEGAVHIRMGAFDRALAAFTEALDAASGDPKRTREQDLATLSLARTYHSLAQFDAAARAYESIPASSPYWAAAALEGGWSRYQMNDFPHALACLEPLRTRSREIPPDTMADALVLVANIAMERNRHQDAMKIVQRLQATVRFAAYEQLRRLAGYEPDALFDLAFSVRAGGTLPPPLAAETTLTLLADGPVARRLDELDELRREVDAMDDLGEHWARTDGGARDELNDRWRTAAHEAGASLQVRLQLATDRLAHLLKESVGIEYVALQREQSSLQRHW
jgi:tetratricopeptide (TPR) repeat protein